MHIRIAPAIKVDHGEVDGLVREAFAEVLDAGAEVQVVATRSPDRWSGKAWPGVPRNRRAQPGVRFLVELVIPGRPPRDGYPFEWRYPGLKTAPPIVVFDWRERLFALAAHEACHVAQFRDDVRRSEVAAERWALAALERMRAEEAAPERTMGLLFDPRPYEAVSA